MKIMIVESSRAICDDLNYILKSYPQVSCCGEAKSFIESLPIIENERPEIIFLDIDLSGKDSFELLSNLDYSPQYIFTSGCPEYAVKSFDFDVVDYLLKPYSSDRLRRAIDKLVLHQSKKVGMDKMDINQPLLLNNGELNYWVGLKDIYYFESCANHSLVVWGKNKALIHRALVNIENRLPDNQFIRVNRKHIVNINHVNKVESWINGGYRLEMGAIANIEVSRRQAGRFKEKFSL